MPGGNRELTNGGDMPPLTELAGTELVPGVNQAGNPVAIPTGLMAQFQRLTDIEDDAAALTEEVADVRAIAETGLLPNLDDVDVVSTTDSNPTVSGFTNGTVHDGFTVTTGMTILRNSALHKERNGPYPVVASGGTARRADMNAAGEFPGATMYVRNGATYGGWTLRSQVKAPFVLDTDPVTFSTANKDTNLVPTMNVIREQRSPLLKIVRAGASTAEHQGFDALVNIRVDGAEKGEVIQWAYAGNGVNVEDGVDGPQYGFIFYAYPSLADFACGSTANRQLLQNFNQDQFVLPIDRKSVTVINPAGRRTMTITMTIDGTKLPATGTPIKATELADPGASYIIDPANVLSVGDVVPDTLV